MIGKIKQIAKGKGYKIFTDPFKLNIWGLRSKNTIPNQFDDEFHVFTNISDDPNKIQWAYFVFPCTTDPGTYWLNHPMNPKGTAIVAPGQYLDTFKVARHLGKYYALCQRLKKITVIRDYNRDSILDFNNGKLDTGWHGTNIHRARKEGTTYTVDRHSAGCQVFKEASHFNFFMKLCEKHREFWGNAFSYTLVDKRIETRKAALKTVAVSSLVAGALIAGFYYVTAD